MGISVLFTDLDGTLLDAGGRLGPRAAEVVTRLRALGVPVVPVTSKSENELRTWLGVLDAGGTGVFENGAGLVTPAGVQVLPAAVPVARLRRILDGAARRRGLRILPLDRIPDPALAALTGLRGDAIDQARRRVWDLPFLAPDGSGDALEDEIGRVRNVRLVRGGIFWHLCGRHDKADAVPRVCDLFRRSGRTVGLGDAPNDARFLAAVDVAVVLPGESGPDARLLAALPGARVAPAPGGEGWAAAVTALLEEEAA
ncbi:MAG TPA: HAD hydrolase family protein [Thermoanaerobaculia bacterium]|nr:HAD hydrolase family protein [Thermoanaerobaculia bacterium]